MKLEEKLFSLRKAKGLSQLKLAEKVGVSRQAISRWEAGVAKPTTENLKCLGELYNVPLEYLLIPVQLVRMELWPNQRHRSLLLILPTRKTKRSQISKTRIISEMSTTAVPLNSHIQLWKEAIRV